MNTKLAGAPTQNKVLVNIANNKEIQKNIKKLSCYSNEQFLSDAKRYIKAVKENRMFCIIYSVSSSGMSRNMAFFAHEKSKYRKNTYSCLNFNALFIALGYTQAREGFRIGGCGMDMVFATNYNNIHTFARLGIISKKDCEVLAQNTPTKL